MKKLFGFFAFIALVANLNAQTSAPAPATGPKMQIESLVVDYGTIAQNSDPLRKVSFKNVGTEPLIIKNAYGSCGCTVPNYKHEPIAPGETSEIEIRYATDRIGAIAKTVTIQTNEGDQPIVIQVKGNVLEKKAEEGVPASPLSMPKQ